MGRGDGSGTDAVAAFGTLANETRLDTLQTLHDALRGHEGPGQPAVPYAELRRRVGVEDSGKFNYHLTELTDAFVRKREGGYVLTQVGRTAVETVRRSFELDGAGFDETAVDGACPRCGASLVAAYDDGHVTTRCESCGGLLGADGLPPGTVSRLPFPPAGVPDHPPTAVVRAAHRRLERHLLSMRDGVCPRCGGATAAGLLTCSDHETGLCRACGTTLPAVAETDCRRCGHGRLAPPALVAVDAPDDRPFDGTTAWDRFVTAVAATHDMMTGEVTTVRVDLGKTTVVVDDSLSVRTE